MTMINCSSNCIHQKDGKCMLEEAISESVSTQADCVFFKEAADRTGSATICNQPCE
ncbi:MAG: hypothetical protein GX279_13140 [Clostridiaceae bacterium]|nr:hypothetical protein [Clostridiaceae bacterium]